MTSDFNQVGCVGGRVSEFEILQNLFSAIQVVIAVFSLFFTIVSGYLAALYFFLNRSPVVMRCMAFGLLSIAFMFLGGTAAVMQSVQNDLFAAHDKLAAPAINLGQLRNPLPVAAASALPFHQQQIGVAIGWGVACAAYIALFYLTFLYRWRKEAE